MLVKDNVRGITQRTTKFGEYNVRGIAQHATKKKYDQ
jgi:hypothetical protein